MHLYWEQDVFDEYELVKYFIYIMDLSFGDFIEKFRKKEIPYMKGLLRASGPLWVCNPIWEGGYLV